MTGINTTDNAPGNPARGPNHLRANTPEIPAATSTLSAETKRALHSVLPNTLLVPATSHVIPGGLRRYTRSNIVGATQSSDVAWSLASSSNAGIARCPSVFVKPADPSPGRYTIAQAMSTSAPVRTTARCDARTDGVWAFICRAQIAPRCCGPRRPYAPRLRRATSSLRASVERTCSGRPGRGRT